MLIELEALMVVVIIDGGEDMVEIGLDVKDNLIDFGNSLFDFALLDLTDLKSIGVCLLNNFKMIVFNLLNVED